MNASRATIIDPGISSWETRSSHKEDHLAEDVKATIEQSAPESVAEQLMRKAERPLWEQFTQTESHEDPQPAYIVYIASSSQPKK